LEKWEQIHRVLQLYDQLRNGETINKSEAATRLAVSMRTIQRDISNIQEHLANSFSGQTVEYDAIKKGYVLTENTMKGIPAKVVLIIAKILLESRALNAKEMKWVIDSLLTYSKRGDEKSIYTAIVGNELLHYRPLQHNQPLIELVWNIAESIQKKRFIDIIYERMDHQQKQHIAKPVAILFSEYYFYLIAFIKDSEHHSPIIFRLDRIRSFKQLDEKFSFAEKDRLEEGILRQRLQFMYTGTLVRLQFKFRGVTVTPVLDRFPNGKIIKTIDDGWLVEVEVYGTAGCMMWLLSQGDKVEVIYPVDLREHMKQLIESMLYRYKEA